MEEYIVHFCEDPDQKNKYYLIVKAINVPTDLREPFRDDPISQGFVIYTIAHNSIEAMFSGEYIMVADALRELDRKE